MNRTKSLLLSLIVFVALGGLLYTIYCTAQQVYRQSANDPQVQLTEDVARILAQGRDPEDVIPKQAQMDMSQSLSAFAMILDENGKVITSSAKLDDKTPTPPKGALTVAKNNQDNRITWEPKKGVRIAAVIKHYSGEKPGYILAGRNLREIEDREKMLLTQVGISGIVLIVLWLISVLLIMRSYRAEEAPTLVEVTEVVAVTEDKE